MIKSYKELIKERDKLEVPIAETRQREVPAIMSEIRTRMEKFGMSHRWRC